MFIWLKNFFKKYLKIFSDPVQITLWNGETIQYGEEPQFHVTFHKPLSKRDFAKDPSIAFGETYMNGDLEIEGNLEKAIQSIYKRQDSF